MKNASLPQGAAFLTERQEVCIGVFDRYRLIQNPGSPFSFQAMDIPAGRALPGTIITVRIDPQCAKLQGQGARTVILLRPDDEQVFIERIGVIGHMIVLRIIIDDFADQPAKLLQG